VFKEEMKTKIAKPPARRHLQCRRNTRLNMSFSDGLDQMASSERAGKGGNGG